MDMLWHIYFSGEFLLTYFNILNYVYTTRVTVLREKIISF